MQGTQVIYLGRSIAKEGFRAYVYGANSAKKLVNSWDEFERLMASGVWFARQEEVIEPKQEIEVAVEEPKQEFKEKLDAARKRGK